MRTVIPEEFVAVGVVDQMESDAAPAKIDYLAKARECEREDPDGLREVIAELRLRAQAAGRV